MELLLNANDLDRFITGNYGEDYFRACYSESVCYTCGEYLSDYLVQCPSCGEYQLDPAELADEALLRRWEELHEIGED